MKLSNEAILPSRSELALLSRSRSALTAGIVHIGVSNFHRSHEAMYLNRLIEHGIADDWAIWGVTMGSRSSEDLEEFRAQDCLYTLTEKSPDGTRTTSVIGSIIGIESATTDHDSVVTRMADPATRIISLTITEGGYGLDPATGEFSGAGDPHIQADLLSAESSCSWLGLVVQAVRVRRDCDAGPLTLMSCDNLPQNGVVTRAALRSFAGTVAPDLLPWIDANVTFPNSMVDRVTPITDDSDRQFLSHQFSLEDEWAVTCEPFSEWVIEDNFANGRPNFEAAGVKLVADVYPYESMKLRLANGSHQALCFFGTLVGYSFVHEAVADPDINAMLLRYIDEEAVPTLSPIASVNPNQWGRTVLQRFANPQIRDRLSRICADTTNRIPKFLPPVIRDSRAAGRPIDVSVAVIASWSRYAQGRGEGSQQLAVVDPRRELVMSAAQADILHPGTFLSATEVFGDLAADADFVGEYTAAILALRRRGARAMLSSLGGPRQNRA